MKKILFLLLISSPAMAQVSEYTFKVTPAEADIISEGLQTQPYGKVFPLMNKLHQQVLEQVKPPEAPKSVPMPDIPKQDGQ